MTRNQKVALAVVLGAIGGPALFVGAVKSLVWITESASPLVKGIVLAVMFGAACGFIAWMWATQVFMPDDPRQR